MMSTSMRAKRRLLRKEKASKEMAKAENPNGVQHVMSIGSQAVAHKDIIVPSIIHGDSQAGVQSAAPLVTIYFSMHSSSEAEG